mmetsp:Transcript_17423/g.43139  ORF Transcript_17423/g.43139 Transcript_17423/m.43139 type:complete len:205 (+) Transcript_17423:273-887(+)
MTRARCGRTAKSASTCPYASWSCGAGSSRSTTWTAWRTPRATTARRDTWSSPTYVQSGSARARDAPTSAWATMPSCPSTSALPARACAAPRRRCTCSLSSRAAASSSSSPTWSATRRGSSPRSRRCSARTTPPSCTATSSCVAPSSLTRSSSCCRRRRSTTACRAYGTCPASRATWVRSSSPTCAWCGTPTWRRTSTCLYLTCR